MAGNFWKSSHQAQWMLEKYDLLRERGEDLRIYNEEEYQKLMIFFCNFITTLGMECPVLVVNKQASRYRQQVIATACVYFRRFYSRCSFKDVDPFLLSATSLLLASKVEEQGILNPVKYANYVQSMISKRFPYVTNVYIKPAYLEESEYILVEVMDCCLIVYQPYRPLLQIINDMRTSPIRNVDTLYHDAWRVCNDSLRTDVALLYSPHVIALAGIMIASMLTNRENDSDIGAWLAEFCVDFEKVFEVMQMVLNLYKLVKSYDEKTQIEGLLKRLPRPSVVQQNPPSGLHPTHALRLKTEAKYH